MRRSGVLGSSSFTQPSLINVLTRIPPKIEFDLQRHSRRLPHRIKSYEIFPLFSISLALFDVIVVPASGNEYSRIPRHGRNISLIYLFIYLAPIKLLQFFYNKLGILRNFSNRLRNSFEFDPSLASIQTKDRYRCYLIGFLREE
jgi:hypothetical protein